MWDVVDLSYVENTADFSLFEPVVDELAKDFLVIRVSRRWAGPMATPLFGDVAIALTVGAAAAAFFGEMGKDMYRALKKGLFTLYRSAKSWANGRGYAPFCVIVTQGPEAGKSERSYHFTLAQGLDPGEFEQAITSIPTAIANYKGQATQLVGFAYDSESGWKVSPEGV